MKKSTLGVEPLLVISLAKHDTKPDKTQARKTYFAIN